MRRERTPIPASMGSAVFLSSARLSTLIRVVAGVVVFAAACAGAQAGTRKLPPSLVFGIYPGGGAGTVGPAGRTAADDPAKQLEALKQLRAPGRTFVLHIYASYSGPGSAPVADQVGRDVALYTAEGFQVELVLTYRPAAGKPTTDVPAFAAFAREAVHTLGSNPRFISLQVTNEANVGNAPNAADGFYAGAEQALIQGLIAAKTEARARGFTHVKVGFNWAYSRDPRETAFWRGLRLRGGSAFRRSLDWVGLDVYPCTWGPRVPAASLDVAARKTTLTSLAALRRRFMPLAGLPAGIPLHISENGYPTGPGRTQSAQVRVMKATIAAVNGTRSRYHVTDYRWFDLRDADSSSSSFEAQYGLLRDDYTPKAGFAAYRVLVAKLGV
jgi:hypothetical protein